MAFKLKGHSLPGPHQRRANLLKVVPNKEAYDKLSPEDKKGFTKAAIKAGLPTKPSPAKNYKKGYYGIK